jgi:hypothetical protein
VDIEKSKPVLPQVQELLNVLDKSEVLRPLMSIIDGEFISFKLIGHDILKSPCEIVYS